MKFKVGDVCIAPKSKGIQNMLWPDVPFKIEEIRDTSHGPWAYGVSIKYNDPVCFDCSWIEHHHKHENMQTIKKFLEIDE